MARTRRSHPDRRDDGAPIDWADRRELARRLVIVVPVAALLFAVTLRTSIAEAFQSARPANVLSWDPDHAGASATVAHRLIAAGQVEEGRRLATQAIARDPLAVRAYAAVGLAAESAGDAARAARFMAFAHAISRRERTTEIWLIRQAIQSADYGGAIRHFDIAMRTSRRGVADLMPLLVASTADLRMIDALTPVLARNPDWKTSFLMSAAIGGPNVDNVVRLSRGRLDPRQADERAVIARLIQRLANERRYDLAWSTYREARPGTEDRTAASIRDTDHAAAAGFPPLDWELVEQPDLTALREPRRDGRPGFALALIAEGGRTGEAARQLVRLTPGVYGLEFVTGAIPTNVQNRPQISLTCAGQTAPFYQARPPHSGDGPRRVRGRFTVPSGCRWQMLSISIGSNETPSEFPWIADITILR